MIRSVFPLVLAVLGAAPALAASANERAARTAHAAQIENLARLEVMARNCRDPILATVDENVRVVTVYASLFTPAADRVLEKARERARARHGSRCRPLAPLLARVHAGHRRLMAAIRAKL